MVAALFWQTWPKYCSNSEEEGQLNKEMNLAVSFLGRYSTLRTHNKQQRCHYKPVSGEGTARLYVPAMVFDSRQSKLLWNLRRRHCSTHILLVGKYQQRSFLQVLYHVSAMFSTYTRITLTAYFPGESRLVICPFDLSSLISSGPVHPPGTDQYLSYPL